MKIERTILVVEDEAAIRRLSARMLGILNIAVIEAGNGEEALQKLDIKNGTIDAVLTDYHLPDISGTELAGWMRQKRPEIPIIYFTGADQRDLSQEEMAREDTYYLGKPFTKESLCAVLDDVFAVC